MLDKETIKRDNENREIEGRYTALSESEKKEIVEKADKRIKRFTIYSVICFLSMIIIIVISIAIWGVENWWYGALFSAPLPCIGMEFLCILLYESKMTEEKKIKNTIKIQIRKEAEQKEWRKSVYDDENIVRVTLIDSYTEVHDKLHAILNYQEIIQTRYYKFKVDYSNGKSVIVTTEDGSTEYCNLIRRLNSSESETSADNVKNSAEELREYKELLDEGIITEEEFNERKKKLLNS